MTISYCWSKIISRWGFLFAVSIEETTENGEMKFEVKVADKDMGKVIGKKGKIAQSIRTVMKAVAGKENKKINIEFID